MSRNRDAALLVGLGAGLFLLLSAGGAAGLSTGRPDEEEEGKDGVPPVRLLPSGRPSEPAGQGDAFEVSAPKRRPSSPGEIRAALGREPTNAELATFERWARDNREAADRILDRERDGTAASADALRKEAADAVRAAQAAAKAAVTPVDPKKQAEGSKLAAKLRDLSPPMSPLPSTEVDVKTAQLILQKLGEKVADDGLYGPKTAAAWKRQAQKLAAQTGEKMVGVFERTDPTHAAVETLAATRLLTLSRLPKGSVVPSLKPKKQPLPMPNPAPPSRGALVNVALAKKTAADVAKHIRAKGRKYTTQVVKQFQQRAGLTDDGMYGPATASALRYFGANAPAPLFKGINAKYVPPEA